MLLTPEELGKMRGFLHLSPCGRGRRPKGGGRGVFCASRRIDPAQSAGTLQERRKAPIIPRVARNTPLPQGERRPVNAIRVPIPPQSPPASPAAVVAIASADIAAGC